LRIGTAAGIGVFLTFIGLRNAGFIVSDPVTFVKLGTLGYSALLTIVGIGITAVLLVRKSAFAFLAGIFFVTLIAWITGQIKTPDQLLSTPDFRSVFLKL